MTERSVPLALALLVAAAYTTAAFATFQFDDWNVIVGNADVASPSAWLASMPGIRPLTKLTFALNRAVDPRPGGFVAFNVACHLASALLALALLRRWLPRFAPGCNAALAASMAAAVFALHPAQTEAVTYIAGRSVSLAALAYLASLYAWERWRDDSSRNGWIVTSVAAFALALAARETAWTLPLAIVLVEAASGQRSAVTLARLRSHLVVAAIAALAIAASPVYRRLIDASLELRGPLDNLASQVDAIAYLVTHPLLTMRVAIDPDVPVAPYGLAWGMKCAGLIAVLAAAVWQWRRRRWLSFAILWFFVHLLPTNSVVARLDPANDRQLYLAMIGPAVGLSVALGGWPAGRARRVVACFLLAALCTATLVRNLDYRSEVALWEATARASPRKARVFNNLGVAYREANDVARARAAFERALALDPDDYKAKQNLRDLPRASHSAYRPHAALRLPGHDAKA
jgi:tetratricopeptide (TPR) repeat protein